ncbi:MAG: LmeA family phospholipid-binding protein [Pyramidobacter sp.]|nr:LmeA family phospholipid-binding protein [Pyramidobacter sp.]
MKLPRTFKAAAVLLFLLLSASVARGADWGQELFGIIVRSLSPERAEMTLSSLPRENGLIPWLYLNMTGSTVQGMRISRLEADGFDVMVSPPDTWKDIEYPKIYSMLSCHADAVITEKDVNDYLMNRAFGDKDEWRSVKIAIKDGRISASAYYIADLKLLKLKIKLEVSCVLAVRNGGEFWLDDIQLEVNNAPVPASYVENALEHIQPIFDLKRYNLSLYISRVEFEEGFCRIRSRILPKPFDGLAW